MSVVNGQIANQTTFNNAFLSRTAAATSTVSKLRLENSAIPASGAAIDNAQQAINETFDAVGMSGIADATRKDYSSNNALANGDSHKVSLGKLDLKFGGVGVGHAHTGTTGDGDKVSASSLADYNDYFVVLQSITVPSASGTTFDVTSLMVGRNAGGGTAVEGVLTSAPDNRGLILNSTQLDYIEDPVGGERVYARITFASLVWTLSFYTNEAGVETAYNLPSQNIKFVFRQVYTSANRPTLGESALDLPSFYATQDVVDASVSQRGLVNTGVQTFAGNKTFSGTISASNLSGTNTGDVSLGAVGSSPNANGATLTGQVLVLELATASFPGLVSTAAQTFAGAKTFNGDLIALARLIGDDATDNTTTGANAALPAPSKTVLKVTESALTSISTVTGSTVKQFFILINKLTTDIALNNNDATDGILTGSGSNFTMKPNAAALLWRDQANARWVVIGGAGGSGGGGAFVVSTVSATGSLTHVADTPRRLILVDASAGNVTITMPAASALTIGSQYQFKRIDSVEANTVTIQRAGGDTIDEGNTQTLPFQWSRFSLAGLTATSWGVL